MFSPNEIRQQITDQIVDTLTNGNLPPWRRQWNNDPNAGLTTSLSTGKPYRGINQLLLQLLAGHRGFQSKWWGTYGQVKDCGAYVLKGEKGTHVVLFKPIKRSRVDETGEEKDDSFFVLRTFVVFNAEQTSGLNQYRVGFAQPKEDTGERYEHADAVIAKCRPTFSLGQIVATSGHSKPSNTPPSRPSSSSNGTHEATGAMCAKKAVRRTMTPWSTAPAFCRPIASMMEPKSGSSQRGIDDSGKRAATTILLPSEY